jgi:hypothetical protein
LGTTAGNKKLPIMRGFLRMGTFCPKLPKPGMGLCWQMVKGEALRLFNYRHLGWLLKGSLRFGNLLLILF